MKADAVERSRETGSFTGRNLESFVIVLTGGDSLLVLVIKTETGKCMGSDTGRVDLAFSSFQSR